MRFTFRPIIEWPAEATNTRKPSPFKASYSRTLTQLERELSALGAAGCVIELALNEADIRNDGLPRASARPRHPGVIVSFDSKHGPLRYATAAFSSWQDNLRAITLGLEALRKVDRYGITRRGEQYTGWKQLAAPAGANGMTRGDAERLLAEYGGDWRRAMLATHPDHGGDPEAFRRVLKARELVG